MRNDLRAAAAVLVLVSTYLLVVGLVAGVVLVAHALAVRNPGAFGAFRIEVAAVLLAAAVLLSLLRLLRRRGAAVPGVALTREEQPRLWAEVDRLAGVVGTPAPDEVRLGADVNAAVTEHARPFRPARRVLVVGAPLLVTSTTGELAAVLAHELGHHSARHTRLARLAHHGQQMLGEVVGRVGPRTPSGRVLDVYGRWYVRVASSVSRAQELEADRLAAAAVGPPAVERAIEQLPARAAAWHVFRRDDLLDAQEHGRRPEHPLLVFAALWRSPVRRREAREWVARFGRPPSPYDTHPPTAERLAALARLEDGGAELDTIPALELLTDPEATLAAVERLLPEHRPDLEPVPWEEVVAERGRRRAGDALSQLGWAARQEGLAEQGTWDEVLDVVRAGRGTRLSGRFMDATSSEEQRRDALAELLGHAVEHELVERHGHRYVADEHGRPLLVDDDGVPAALDDLVRSAVDEPRAVDELRAVLTRLTGSPGVAGGS